ncbi:hydroxymethylbilane synthase [Desulfocicer vacuolatum]|nr:hydroxymethylbilane synthase [Desulfocicer vacuolatum]
MKNIIKIGTRGSQLALWQANWVKNQIESGFPEIQALIIEIKTTGDKIVDRPLAMVGGKGLFVKEIEKALLDKDIDIAVHSMKDMPGDLPGGLCIGAIPVREDPRDVLVSRNNIPLNELPSGAVIGTSSLRRASQIKYVRPDLTIASIRGNLGTRLGKLDNGDFDAIVLAAAGIIRLGMKERITQYLEPDTMLPAVGQGALCIETRENDADIAPILAVLDNRDTRIPVVAERAFLRKLEGSCHIPVACFGTLKDRELILTGLVASEDGTQMVKEVSRGPGASAEAIGTSLATTLLDRGAAQILENL